jgi:hypothetical protein
VDLRRLFDTRGRHIANLIDGHLYTPAGRNIGHYMETECIVIDMSGRYLGEIVFENRLLRRRGSQHVELNLGVQGNLGDRGHMGDPGNYGESGKPEDYVDIPMEALGVIDDSVTRSS